MKNVIKQVLLELAKPLAASSVDKKAWDIVCSDYSKKDYEHYIIGHMNEYERDRFEAHCMNCSNCLIGLYFKNDRIENRLILEKTGNLMDQMEETNKANLLDVVIKAAHGILQVIKTSGEVLQVPQPVPVRGDNSAAKTEEKVSIVHDISPISMQSSFQHAAEQGKLLLTLSFYNNELDEFLKDIKIHLSGKDIDIESSTDQGGEAVFIIQAVGRYRINIKMDESTHTMDLKISE